jgi:hypothetical protein
MAQGDSPCPLQRRAFVDETADQLRVAHRQSVLRELERHDVQAIQVDFSESHRFAIAGLHCATLELQRDQDDGDR